MTSTIVLLNGAGSAGKSSIARALQTITEEPFLHVQMDTFLEMLPVAYQDDQEGVGYETMIVNGNSEVAIRLGPVGRRLLDGMRHAVAALARQDNNLIVDDVLCNGEMAIYANLLAAFRLCRIGVIAPLNVLEARERARADRMTGLARWQYPRVHAGVTYDLEVDTSRMTSLECAAFIKERFSL